MTPAELAGATRLLVLQPTPFCNIDCGYCYLPRRNDRHRMPHDLVEAAARFVFDHQLAAPDFTVVWHAGEPLVLPPVWYAEAFERVARAAPAGAAVQHAIQTNGMLLNDAWCDLFAAHRVELGVSLDGPARLHDARRRTRTGAGTHAAVMRGIERLRRRDIPFHVICVVGDASLECVDELVDFFLAQGIRQVGFSIEEVEGVNRTSTLYRDGIEPRFRAFFTHLIARAQRAGPALEIRECRNLLDLMAHPSFGQFANNAQNAPFGIVTVSSRGALFTFSPELAGLDDARYGTLAVGQLPGATLETVLAGEAFRRMWADVASGIAACRASCRYFDLCLGGAPANKLAEHGTFAVAETMHCRLAQQCVADATLAHLEQTLAGAKVSAAAETRLDGAHAFRANGFP
jgi:uncharacterized protein